MRGKSSWTWFKAGIAENHNNLGIMKKDTGFKKIDTLLDRYQEDDVDKYISREFQKYGYGLAKELGDLKRKALYIKLAKETPRGVLETARTFVSDAEKVKSKPKLFMWKLKQLKGKIKTE